MLREIIERETASNCVFTFSKAVIKEHEFTTQGVCKECEGNVVVTSSNNRRTFQINITIGPHQHTNTKLCRLTRVKSESIAHELVTKSVNDVYLSQANNISIDVENVPRNFVTKKAIENIKARKNRLEDSAVNVLRQMKYSPDFDGCIKELATDPFCVMFWTKNQQFYYAETRRKYGIDLSIDATGGLILNRSLTSDIQDKLQCKIDLPHIFLYLISLKIPGHKSIPIGQMLSAQQDSLRISYFLDRWTLDFGVLREIVMDESTALLKSCATSFAHCRTINEYILKCFNVLKGNCNDLPKSYIRLDVAHFTHKLHRNKILKSLNPVVRQLYLSVFGFLMQCEKFETISAVVKDLVMLCNYPFFGAINGNDLPTTKCHQSLLKLVRSHQLSLRSDFEFDDDDEDFDDLDFQLDHNQIIWYDEILNDVTKK